MIELMKASAGSGKTYNLAKKYIFLCLDTDDIYAYRHILAVTFTNKATEEMKRRILDELHKLATDTEKSNYYSELMACGRFGTAEELKKAAAGTLKNILHDYSAFAVSTIDSFFQRTLKAFAREIGQFASYQVELDKDMLIMETVDRVLDNLSEEDNDMLKWLTDNAMEQINSGNGYKLEALLQVKAGRLKSEKHRDAVERYKVDETLLYAPESIKKMREICNDVIYRFELDVCAKAKEVADAFRKKDGTDLLPETYKGFLVKIRAYATVEAQKGKCAKVEKPTASLLDRLSDRSKWFAQKNAGYLGDIDIARAEMAAKAFTNLFSTGFRYYRTAISLKDQVFGFGMAHAIYETFNEILKEKNVLSIDDTNTYLKDIIDGSDAPFVYEKIGVKYEHFLLDEFQDTSQVQWDNFKPLLQNSDAEGHYSLIVGDVKQSIYRFRNSDWRLLDHIVRADFREDSIKDSTLRDNRRSASNIVSFNNGFFKWVTAKLDSSLSAGREEKTIDAIYDDVVQNIVNTSEGSVRFRFCDSEQEAEKVYEAVMEAHNAGFSYSDIAILVRGNKEGGTYASYLIDKGISVVTDDSLKISSSVTVRRMVSLLASISNPKDSIAGYFAKTLEMSVPASYHSLIDLCENLLRPLKKYDEKTFDGEVLYIQSFMDMVQDYVSIEGNDLQGFLDYWKDNERSISSPSLGDSVRIITIHKSKGLGFNYVILPSLEKIKLFRDDDVWCGFESAETPFESIEKGIYDVHLSQQSEDTLFADEYRKELKMQYIDNLNILYVALTRPRQGIYFIGKMPSKSFLSNMNDTDIKFTTFAEAVYAYASVKGILDSGTGRIGRCMDDDVPADMHVLDSGYPSIALNPVYETLDENGELVDVRVAGRLKFRADAVDFFAEDGKTGASASHRLRGIVLHKILSSVRRASELDAAVEATVAMGELSEEEAVEAKEMLRNAIESVKDRGWFPEKGARILNEKAIIDEQGHSHRPDRVVLHEDATVSIIDFKFGEHEDRYFRQIARYGDLYRRMGYSKVRSFLWYVERGEIKTPGL